MCSHLLSFTIWIYSLVILLTTGESQSTTNLQEYHSETDEIIAYGVNVLRTIIQHCEGDGNFINILRNITITNSKINQLMKRSPSSILEKYSCKQQSGLQYLNKIFQNIDNEYNDFEKYLEHINDKNHKFPLNIVSIHETGFLDVYAQISLTWINITHPMDNPELFEALVDRYNPMVESNCTIAQSLNQYIYDLYNQILLEIIKVYSIIMYYQKHVSIEKNNNHRGNVLMDIINDFEIHVLRVTDNALKAMERSPRYILQRDPTDHIKGITYDSLDYFLQGYVTDQKYLRQDNICIPMCSEYNDTIHYNHTDAEHFPRNSICTGRIRSCTNTEVERMCLAPWNSTRRYDGLSNIPPNREGSKYWGRTSISCSTSTARSVRFSSPSCRICSCTCDMVDSPNSIRYVDLRQRETRYFDSFVITGIRFRIINRVLYLQIQEGQLRDGEILPETVAWKEIEYTDRDHNNDSQLFKLDYDNRLFDLSDLTVPGTYAIIILGFTIMDGIVGLQILSRPIQSGPHWILNKKAQPASFRPVFQPDGFDIPTIKSIKNSKVSESNKFLLKFKTSDWKNDAAQNVVPFIDIQDVVTDPPAPISGIGIHVRHGGTSGGFLAPKIISCDNRLKIIPQDIKETIESLAPDLEMTAHSEAIIMEKDTQVPVVILSTPQRPRHQSVTMRRAPLLHFIGVRG